MADAYEIGISLALQDGVSAGLGIIRRDLAALDRAIATTDRNLSQLRGNTDRSSLASARSLPLAETLPREGAKLTSADSSFMSNVGDVAVARDGSEARRGDVGAPPQVQLSKIPAAASAVTSTIVSPASPSLRRQSDPDQAPYAPQSNPSSDPEAPSTSRLSGLDPVQSKPTASDFTAPVAPRKTSLETGLSKKPRRGLVGEQNLIVTQGPRASGILMGDQTSGPKAPIAQPAIDPRAASVAQTRLPPYQKDGVSPIGQRSGYIRVAEAMPLPTSFAAPVEKSGLSEAGSRAAADQSPTDRLKAAPAAAIDPTPQRRARSSGDVQPVAAAAPASSSTQTITLQGDVILDGARVGRWMTSNLARQAARPTASPTGPDPRQTPLWSGQAQGF